MKKIVVVAAAFAALVASKARAENPASWNCEGVSSYVLLHDVEQISKNPAGNCGLDIGSGHFTFSPWLQLGDRAATELDLTSSYQPVSWLTLTAGGYLYPEQGWNVIETWKVELDHDFFGVPFGGSYQAYYDYFEGHTTALWAAPTWGSFDFDIGYSWPEPGEAGPFGQVGYQFTRGPRVYLSYIPRRDDDIVMVGVSVRGGH